MTGFFISVHISHITVPLLVSPGDFIICSSLRFLSTVCCFPWPSFSDNFLCGWWSLSSLLDLTNRNTTGLIPPKCDCFGFYWSLRGTVNLGPFSLSEDLGSAPEFGGSVFYLPTGPRVRHPVAVVPLNPPEGSSASTGCIALGLSLHQKRNRWPPRALNLYSDFRGLSRLWDPK